MNNEESLEIYQIKLTNGDEIMAGIELWDYDTEIILRHPLIMTDYEFAEDSHNRKKFLFKPWMSYQDEFNDVVYVNPFSIVCFHKPTPLLAKGYEESVKSIQDMYAENDKTPVDTPINNNVEYGDRVVSIFRDEDS